MIRRFISNITATTREEFDRLAFDMEALSSEWFPEANEGVIRFGSIPAARRAEKGALRRSAS